MLTIQYGNIEKYFEGDNSVIDSLESMDFFIIAFALLFVLAFIVTVVAVCVWVYRANQNLHRGGLNNIEYSSGWSVGWFFIPFANLVKPAYVMGEIDRGTNQLSGDFKGERWKDQENNSTVVMWWLFYILSGIFTNVSEKMIDENHMDLNNYSLISGLELMSFVFSLISAIMLYKLVTKISDKQEKIRTSESPEEV